VTFRDKLARWIKLFRAHVQLNCYLLRYGMWRGECQFAAYDTEGKQVYLAAVKGSLQRHTVKHVRTFWDEKGWADDYPRALNLAS
jgi:hypothetical protein